MLRLYTLGTVNLFDAHGRPCATLLAQRKRLAVLLYLTLTARSGPTRRDTLLPLFWPERDDAQGRHALRQVLHFLRRSLSPSIVVTGVGEGLLVDLSAVECDAIAFEQALDAGQPSEALALYGGDLLPGLFVSDAPQFERWLEDERSRLRRRAADAAWGLARGYAAQENAAAAEQLARRAAAMTPGDEGALCRLIELLEQVGSFTAAIRAYEQFAEMHAAEYGEPPAAETRALAQRVRSRLDEPARAMAGAPAPVSVPISVPVSVPASLAPRPPVVSPVSGVPSAPPRMRIGARVRGRLRGTRLRWVIAMASAGIVGVVGLAFASAAVVRRTEGDAREVAATETSRQLYEVGLRLASQSDDRNAARFFLSALAEDSTSALAAYHAALSETTFDRWSAQRDFTRAWRLAEHASAHDALTIRQSYAAATNDRRALLLADSLVARFPAEAEGELALGKELSWSGAFLAAVPHLRRAISIDSASRANPDAPGAPCWACQAYYVLVTAYRHADSIGAAEREARAWTGTYPGDPTAWFTLASVAEYEAQADSALVYGRRGNPPTPSFDESVRRARIGIRAGAFADADRVLWERARDGAPDDRLEALWWLIISLRNQGRLHDALDVADRWQRESEARSTERASNNATPTLLPAAQIAFESGHYGAAAAVFDSILHAGRPEPPTSFFDAPSLMGRHRTWIAAHLATALAAAGDTAPLPALVDSITRWGSIEGYGRDQRLHYYASGLLLRARGDTAAAIDAFRRSIYSTTEGFTRAQFEAGRLLLAQGRAREAIAMVQPALRGNLEASNFYVTRTELHELLAHAFSAAGMVDSAKVHYAYVAGGWRRADPPFRARSLIAIRESGSRSLSSP